MAGCHITTQRADNVKEFQAQEETKVIQETFNDLEALRNAMADLSVRLNQIQSTFREFEKQRIDPIAEAVGKMAVDLEVTSEKFSNVWETIDNQNKIIDHLTQRLDDFESRLDELEEGDYE